MGLFRSAAAVASINLKRWLKDARVHFVFLFMGLIVIHYLSNLTIYGLEHEKTCSIYLMPHLFISANVSVNVKKTILHLGMLILLCDAPFLTKITPYMILRSRRTAWCIGECMYILAAALIYTLFLAGISMVTVLPVAEFGNEWGSVARDAVYGKIGDVGSSAAGVEYSDLRFSSYLYRYVYPQGGQLTVMAAVWCSFSFLGLLMYVVSLASKKLLPGMCVSGFFVFLDPLINWWMPTEWAAIVSPVTWTSIDRMRSPAVYQFMTLPLAFGLYGILIVLLFVAALYVSRRTMIEVRSRK